MKLFFVSLSIALLIAPIYTNITNKIHNKFKKKSIIHFITFGTIIISSLPIVISFIIFGVLSANIFEKVPTLVNNLKSIYNNTLHIIEQHKNLLPPDLDINSYIYNIEIIINLLIATFKNLSINIGSILTYFILIILFLELILTIPYFIYKKHTNILSKHNIEVLKNIIKLLKDFLQGLLIVRILLFVSITLILWILNVPEFIFWSLLASVLSIIPYLGLIGIGLICATYSGIMLLSLNKFLLISIIFVAFHLLESNILTPIIVGKKIKLNALSIFVGLVIGLMLWGVIGMLLALPILATIRILGEHYSSIKPISILIADD